MGSYMGIISPFIWVITIVILLIILLITTHEPPINAILGTNADLQYENKGSTGFLSIET